MISFGKAVGVAGFGAVANGVVAARLGGDHTDLEEVLPGSGPPAIHGVYCGAVAAVLLLVIAPFSPEPLVNTRGLSAGFLFACRPRLTGAGL